MPNPRLSESLTAARVLVAAAAMVVAAHVTPASADPITFGTLGDFALLSLNNGYLSINSSNSITGNIGASSNVDIASAQKVDTFNGKTYLFSGTTTADFISTYTDATFNPSGGIHSGNTSGCPGGDPLFTCDGATVNNKLNQANTDAASLITQLSSLSYSSLGNVTNSLNLTGNFSGLNAYDAATWKYDSDTLTLNGNASSWFVFKVGGTANTWAQSQVVLNGVDPNHLLFYLTGNTALGDSIFTVSKDSTVFGGTIFAPFGDVEYHNPATFTGRIIAESITVHSDFNISSTPLTFSSSAVPEPASVLLLGTGLAGVLRRRFRRAA